MKMGTANFDCADIYREHAFLVRLTKGRSGQVQVFEVFGRLPAEREAHLNTSDISDVSLWAPETILRCDASREIWDAISPEARSEFNRRLKSEGKPAGRWGAEETAVQRLLGKELLVLLWAAELPGVSEEEIAAATRNWLGLKPEERWWLYTMTAAATGLAHQAGMGWRGALRQALCFGTRLDAFHLGAVAGRGTLAPRANEEFAAEGTKPKRASRKKRADEPGLFLTPLPAE
ncbi:MAG: DUF3780 domain-containing protein [Beijerinckiaceae bacterium]